MSWSKEEKSSEVSSQFMGLKMQELYTVNPNPNGLENINSSYHIHKLNGKIFLFRAHSIKFVIDGKGMLNYLTRGKRNGKKNSKRNHGSLRIPW